MWLAVLWVELQLLKTFLYIYVQYDLTLYMQIFMFDKRAFFFYLDFAAYLNSDVKIINVELF